MLSVECLLPSPCCRAAKVCSSTCSCEEVEEAVVNGLEAQLLPAIAPAPGGSGVAGTSTLPMVSLAPTQCMAVLTRPCACYSAACFD